LLDETPDALNEEARSSQAPATRYSEGRWSAPGELARPSLDAVLASPGVTVSSPGLLPDRARNGHALTSGSI